MLKPAGAQCLQDDQQDLLNQVRRRRGVAQVTQPVAADPDRVLPAQLSLFVRSHRQRLYRSGRRHHKPVALELSALQSIRSA